MKLRTYIHFGGNCLEALDFYQEHLGGKIVFKMTYGQMPGNSSVPEEQKDRILHATIMIGDVEILASDTPPGSYQPMRSAYLVLNVDSVEEAERVYALLSNGGEIFMKMEETFFAQRYAMLRDRFGTQWMIMYQKAE